MKQKFKMYVLWLTLLAILLLLVSDIAVTEQLRYAPVPKADPVLKYKNKLLPGKFLPAQPSSKPNSPDKSNTDKNIDDSNLPGTSPASNPLTAPAITPKNTTAESAILPLNYSVNLYKLLLADTARQRNIPDIAIENYLQAASDSKDPKIAKLAVSYAIDIRAFKQAKAAARLWADLDITAVEAQLIAVTLLISSDSDAAKKYLTQAIVIAPNAIAIDLSALYRKLSPFSQNKLLAMLTDINKAEPNNPFIYMYLAQLTATENNIAQVNTLINQALSLKPNLTAAIQLKAKLIRYEKNDDLPALRYLAQEIAKLPHDYELILFYCNALLDNNDAARAIPLLKKIIKAAPISSPYLSAAKLALGEALTLQGDLAGAKNTLMDLSANPEYYSTAAYFLGQIFEQQNKLNDATNWYAKVESGEYHVPATIRAATIMLLQGSPQEALYLIQNASPSNFAEQKQLLLNEIDVLLELEDPTQALSIVNNALLILPNDIEFLYARSVIAGSLNRQQDMEHDLMSILKLDPNHANALNALGFTLSTQPKRTTEAMQYLKRALAISPNNPLFMDSMGWLLYQMGKLQESISYLENAYSISRNSDIAAHLGEVLWANGNKNKAMNIWKSALNITPNHRNLLNILKKLKIELTANVKTN